MQTAARFEEPPSSVGVEEGWWLVLGRYVAAGAPTEARLGVSLAYEYDMPERKGACEAVYEYESTSRSYRSQSKRV